MKSYRMMVLMPLILTLFLMVAGCSGKIEYMIPATPVAGPAPDKALVYFMRPFGAGHHVDFQIWDADHFVGFNRPKSYLAYECNPGMHLFIGIAENKVAVEADLEAGKSYYVVTKAWIGWVRRMRFTPVTEDSELWDKVEAYKQSLRCLAAKQKERAKWEAAKKQEVLKMVDYFTGGAGAARVLKLGKEEGR